MSSFPKIVLVNRCFIKNAGGKLLILQRSHTDRNKPSKWEIAGGKVDPGQNISEARAREVWEETGLTVELAKELMYVYDHIITDGHYKGALYVASFYITKVTGGTLELSSEHADYTWVTVDQMLQYDLTHEVKKATIALKKHLE